jgi:D-alanyl-D-alanine carboxypeptidase
MVMNASMNRRTLLGKAAAAALAAPAFAALVPAGSDVAYARNELKSSLDAILAGAVANGFPGIALYVEQAGKQLYFGAAGVSSVEQEKPLKPNDRQRIYSITKTFTAIVTLQLVDEGVLSLDDTITKWLDDPAVLRIPNVDQITLYQLLVHTSGIYDFFDETDSSFLFDAFLGPDADWSKVWTPWELIAYADGANHAPYGAPGELYHYSNTNFILIGLIVEKATGHAYTEELHTRILDRLHLKDTFLVEGQTMPDGTVDIYSNIDGQLVNISASNLGWAWTFGGMVSTPKDLARFARAVYGGELVSSASFAKMFDFFPAKHEGYYEGIGVYKTDTPSGQQIYGSDGNGPGASSSMMRLVDADLTVILINNLGPDGGASELLVYDVFDAVIEAA